MVRGCQFFVRIVEALLDALWQTMARAGSLSLQQCLASQLEGPGRVFVNQLVALFGSHCDRLFEGKTDRPLIFWTRNVILQSKENLDLTNE